MFVSTGTGSRIGIRMLRCTWMKHWGCQACISLVQNYWAPWKAPEVSVEGLDSIPSSSLSDLAVTISSVSLPMRVATGGLVGEVRHATEQLVEGPGGVEWHKQQEDHQQEDVLPNAQAQPRCCLVSQPEPKQGGSIIVCFFVSRHLTMFSGILCQVNRNIAVPCHYKVYSNESTDNNVSGTSLNWLGTAPHSVCKILTKNELLGCR